MSAVNPRTLFAELTGAPLLEPSLSSGQLFPVCFPADPPPRPPLGPQEYDGDSWMASDRRRTARGVLALSLNIGVDPPDVVKRDPCAFLECWQDPFAADADKSVQQVGETLVKQYDFLQPRSKYIPLGDPNPSSIEQECKRARRAAGADRVLFHFNGHGVPACTASGEIWVFNEDFTQYLPVSMYELMHWLVEPSVYVFDCNGAGHMIDWYHNALLESSKSSGQPVPSVPNLVGMSVMFAACGKSEVLPANPSWPADLFTSCLTTPIRMALLWHVLEKQRNLLAAFSDLERVLEELPGQLDNRRTPLGELNWIFTAITDAIAYQTCTPELFQKLFREDTLLAALSRNFLLAERIMRSSSATPISFPALPSTAQHPLWLTWDLEVERCIAMHALKKPQALVSRFFEDQLTAVDLWTQQGGDLRSKPSPQALPCLLQALLSQSMRERALWCLARYMDLGPWAVGRALSLGVFPYLLKLLKSGSRNLRAPLMLVWGKVVALEPKTIPELASKETIEYFLHTLASGSSDDTQRVMACFVLAQCCAAGGDMRALCVQGDMFSILTAFCKHSDLRLRTWCAIAAGFAWKDSSDIMALAAAVGAADAVAQLHTDSSARVRAACAFAMGTARGTKINLAPLALLGNDGKSLVRREAQIAALAQFQAEPIEFRKAEQPQIQALIAVVRRAATMDPDPVARRAAMRAVGLVGVPTASTAKIGFTMGKKAPGAIGTSMSSLPTAASTGPNLSVPSKSPKSPRSFGWKRKEEPVVPSVSATVVATVGVGGPDELSPPVSPRMDSTVIAAAAGSASVGAAASGVVVAPGAALALMALGPECPSLELGRIHLPLTVDSSDPAFVVAANLQQRHTAALSETLNKVLTHKKHINQIPHDREKARLPFSNAERVTALCFAPGPPELLLVARGKSVSEWREKEEEDIDADDADQEDESSVEKNGSEEELLRRLQLDVDVTSCAALNGHHFPLWALACNDGNVRIWGRNSDIVSAWMCEDQLACLSFDAPNALLYAGGGSSVQVWDCSQELLVKSYSFFTNVTAVFASSGSSLSAAGTRDGVLAMCDYRQPAPIHQWHEQKGQEILGTSICGTHSVVSGSSDGAVLFWDLRAPSHSLRSVKVPLRPNQLARCMSAHPLFGQIAVGTSEGATVLSGASGKTLSSIKYYDCGLGSVGPVEKLAFGSLGSSLALGLANDVLIVGA